MIRRALAATAAVAACVTLFLVGASQAGAAPVQYYVSLGSRSTPRAAVVTIDPGNGLVCLDITVGGTIQGSGNVPVVTIPAGVNCSSPQSLEVLDGIVAEPLAHLLLIDGGGAGPLSPLATGTTGAVTTVTQPPTSSTAPACDPNYVGACIPPGLSASDVNCAPTAVPPGGYQVQVRVQVVGTDVYDLDRDGDGYGCDALDAGAGNVTPAFTG
jgi:hypothetical protein